MNSDPLITILMPVYNGMPFLPEAMDCLLRQTENRIRILVINDGSSDDSESYVRSIDDTRIKILSLERVGLVKALNKGLELVGTPFVGRMDADDLCDERKFELQLEFLIAHPECVGVGTSANHLSSDGQRKGWPVHMPNSNTEIVRSLLMRRSALIHPTILARTEIVKAAGGYREEAWPAEDYDLFFRLSIKGPLANLPQTLYSIRLHGSSITAQSIMKSQSKYEEVRKKYSDFYQKILILM